MHIRLERPQDTGAIRIVTDAAFRGVPYSDQTEARIVEALRAAGALTVSLVADSDGDVIGHVAFSPIQIDAAEVGWVGLGPVSVKPDRQRMGVGGSLIREGLRQLRSAGVAGCVVFGDPAYYVRFGFECDPGLVYPPSPPGYFQRLILQGARPKGEVTYHPAFGMA
jgi:putative acetyltransferase